MFPMLIIKDHQDINNKENLMSQEITTLTFKTDHLTEDKTIQATIEITIINKEVSNLRIESMIIDNKDSKHNQILHIKAGIATILTIRKNNHSNHSNSK